MKRFSLYGWPVFFAALLIVGVTVDTVTLFACSPAQVATVERVVTEAGPLVVTVASDLCQEAASQPEPGWIDLICWVDAKLGDATADASASDAGAPMLISVRMPRAQWVAVKARASKAPGR